MRPDRTVASPHPHRARALRTVARHAAAAIAGAALSLLGAPPSAAQTAPPPRVQDADTARVVSRWLEAEDAVLDRPLRVQPDRDASGGAYVEADDRHASRGRPPRDGHARIAFTLEAAGTYRLLGRAGAPEDDEDSFWIRIDDGGWIRWNGVPETGGWRWSDVTDADRGDAPVRLDLAAGRHVLTFAYREGGARLDRLLLTSDPDLTPDGPGPLPPRVQVIFRRDGDPRGDPRDAPR